MKMKDSLMKIALKVQDVVALAKRFEAAPVDAWREVVEQARDAVIATLEQVMNAELELFLGQEPKGANKRNGFTTRTYAVKGLGALRVRVPRDRAGKFESKVVPPSRHYDEATERDLALLHLAGLSTRMLSQVSGRVLGIRVSAQEVSNALKTIVPAAKKFLERPLGGGRWHYLYVDGTNFTYDSVPLPAMVTINTAEWKSSHQVPVISATLEVRNVPARQRDGAITTVAYDKFSKKPGTLVVHAFSPVHSRLTITGQGWLCRLHNFGTGSLSPWCAPAEVWFEYSLTRWDQ